jgi:hypothetical protein
MPLILIFILILLIIIILALEKKNITGAYRSHLEHNVIEILENITGRRFYPAYPEWLKDPKTGVQLELDGYNEDLKLAVEVQGPGHYRPYDAETILSYNERIERDKLKKKLCQDHGINLLQFDYRIPIYVARPYIISRLYDYGIIQDRPKNYSPEINGKPWQVND